MSIPALLASKEKPSFDIHRKKKEKHHKNKNKAHKKEKKQKHKSGNIDDYI